MFIFEKKSCIICIKHRRKALYLFPQLECVEKKVYERKRGANTRCNARCVCGRINNERKEEKRREERTKLRSQQRSRVISQTQTGSLFVPKRNHLLEASSVYIGWHDVKRQGKEKSCLHQPTRKIYKLDSKRQCTTAAASGCSRISLLLAKC